MNKIILSANTDWFLYNFRFSLAKFLSEQGFNVVLVSPPGKYTSNFEQNGFRWLAWDLGRQSIHPWREIKSLKQLIQIYKKEKPNLIHHHTIKPVLYGSSVARILGLRNVVNSITGRGYVFSGNDLKAKFLKQLVSPFYRYALNHPNYAIIFENKIDKQYFIDHKFIPEERTWLIGGVGVDINQFTPSPEPEDIPTILYSGRMLWDKGVGILVEAARLLKSKIECRIVLVGEPDPGNPSSIDPQQLQNWDNEGIIEWLGWKSDMHKVYQQSNIVTLPTMYGEGVPTVLLEAAASGRATVATDILGCRDITIDGFTGLLIPVNDQEALANALLKLITDPGLRHKMGSNGRQLVLEKFTTDHVNKATMGVYVSVLY